MESEAHLVRVAAEIVGHSRLLAGDEVAADGMLRRPPSNVNTGHRYTGLNMVNLYLAACQKSWADMRFLTQKQIAGMGGHLKPGATGVEALRPIAASGRDNLVLYQDNELYNITETTLGEAAPVRWSDYRFFDYLPKVFGIRAAGDDGDTPEFDARHNVLIVGRGGQGSQNYYARLVRELFRAVAERENRVELRNDLGQLREYLFCSMVGRVFGIGCRIDGKAPVDASNVRWHAAIVNNAAEDVLVAAADAARLASGVFDVAAGEQPSGLPWVKPIDFSKIPQPLKAVERPLEVRSERPEKLAQRIMPAVCGGPGREQLADQIGEILASMPRLLSGERNPDQCMAVMKIVDGNGDTGYLLEFDKVHGSAFGWVIPDGNVFSAEGRMYSAADLAAVDSVDLSFTPRNLAELADELEENAMIDCGYVPQGHGEFEDTSMGIPVSVEEGFSPSM